MSAIRSHSLSIGIVGLPNAGKSTLFNSLTENTVPAENFPFCTIDKNVGVVEVPDPRLESLSKHYQAQKVVPSAITFVDIAGLVKGASEGEGLGNQFLSHIREVDMIMYVLRAFRSQTITHIYERIDPWDDFQIVQTELILKDLDTVERKYAEISKKARVTKEKEIQLQTGTLEKLKSALGEGIPAIDVQLTKDEKEFADDLWLLSSKPRLFILNVQAESLSDAQTQIKMFEDRLPDCRAIAVDVKIVGDLSRMNEAEKFEYIDLLGYQPILIDDVIHTAFEQLQLITFYTGSEKECNAWSIVQGATAKRLLELSIQIFLQDLSLQM